MVERAEVTTIASAPRMSEADLARHLSNGNGKGENGSRERSTQKASIDLRSDDNQLYEALNLLKGIALSRSPGLPEAPPG